MEFLASIDQTVFFFINHLPHPRIVNLFAQLLSVVGTAGIIWFALGVLVFIREEKKDKKFVLQMAAMGVLTFILNEIFLKPFIGRLRPAVEMGAIIIGSNVGDSFSFPSGHAAISFAAAVVLSKKEPRWKWTFYTLAVLISLSRIYLGKHYPLDVLMGGVLGWGIGIASLRVSPYLQKKLVKLS